MTHRTGRIGRLCAAASTAALAGALAVGVAGAPALADPISDTAFHGAYPMAESELDDLRGGFVLPDTLLYFTINAQSQIIDNVTGDLLDGGFDITLDTRIGIPTNLPDNVLVDAKRRRHLADPSAAATRPRTSAAWPTSPACWR